jgi:hypothetical protein
MRGPTISSVPPTADCLNQFAARIESLARLKRGSVQIGTITEVHGPVVEIVCDHLPPLHQALYAGIDHEAYTFEAQQHLDEKRVRTVALNRTSGLQRGMPVFDTGAALRLLVSPQCLGRLPDGYRLNRRRAHRGFSSSTTGAALRRTCQTFKLLRGWKRASIFAGRSPHLSAGFALNGSRVSVMSCYQTNHHRSKK